VPGLRRALLWARLFLLSGPAAVSGSAENEFTALRIVYALSGEPGFALKALTCF
jgi:hypothetical protein